MKLGKIVMLTTISVIGVLAIIGVIVAYAVYPIEADRPADIRPELWFDTKDFYEDDVKFVEDAIAGKRPPAPSLQKQWMDKYLDAALSIGDDQYTPQERELAKAMNNLNEAALDYVLAYWQNKNHEVGEEQVKRAQERYEDAKKTIEGFYYVWK